MSVHVKLPGKNGRTLMVTTAPMDCLTSTGLSPLPTARPAGHAGDKDDPGCRRKDKHRLIIFNMWIFLQPPKRPQGTRPADKLDTVLLDVPAHAPHFSNELAQRIGSLLVADKDVSMEN
ncbi:unnamed protein product [Dibothriocephalus latus]|uniref:Uncharacterized protein n=1 Tax=Dibothriocephalus latus TaxID=60516 RepID=A0A3P7MDN6_DIBLA|nr:unnamed protein product [Dibothriocephalus latus]